MNAKAEIKENTLAIKQLLDGWAFLRDTEVLVGIPKERNASHGGITNAELLYIHTNGSPVNGIPARPTVEPGITEPETLPVIQKLLGEGMKQAVTGNISAAKVSYKKAGIVGENASKAVFGSAKLVPLKPATVARRKKNSAAPLVDTGVLRNAVTHVIRSKKG